MMSRLVAGAISIFVLLPACGGSGGDGDGGMGAEPLDPSTAPVVAVDRFSADAAALFVRSADNGLPGADEPIDFDQGPFITRGLGPAGESVRYYNFDVMPVETAPIFALFREGEDHPVDGQLNIIDVIPGDAGYNDFWHVHKVTVPADYVANTITSREDIMAGGYTPEPTDILVNCPVVPDGSTAALRQGGGSSGLVSGWYRDQVVKYFEFSERMLTVTPDSPMVPLSPIYVTFNANPDEADPASGPPSGFVTEDGTDQTHNVVATLPSDEAYSPLWMVNVYDNADFDTVMDLSTAEAATQLGSPANVNCPIVSVE